MNMDVGLALVLIALAHLTGLVMGWVLRLRNCQKGDFRCENIRNWFH